MEMILQYYEYVFVSFMNVSMLVQI